MTQANIPDGPPYEWPVPTLMDGTPVFSDAGQACRWLEERGFEQIKDWNWMRPHKDYVVLPIEWVALNYLANEWDWGYLV